MQHKYTPVPTAPHPTAKHSAVTSQTVITATWVVLAMGVPVYRLLGEAGDLWTYAVVVLIIALVGLGRGAAPRFPAIWIFAGYAALVAGISSSATAGLGATMPVAIQIAVLLGFGPFALRGCVTHDPQFLRKTGTAFVLVQTASAVAGIVQLLGVPIAGFASVYGRSPGLAGHPNILGVMAGTAIMLCVHQSTRPDRTLGKRAVNAALLINIGGLLSTGSVSSMIATALGALFVLSANKVSLHRVLWSISAGFVALALLVQIPAVARYFRSPTDRILQVTGQTDDISTLGIRLQTYAAAWSRIKDDPFMGKGLDYGSSGSVGTTAVHNIFLRAWYQGGILLAVAVGLVLLAALFIALRNVRAHRHGASTGVLVVLLSYSLTAAFFEQAYYWLPVLAAWVALPRYAQTAEVTTRPVWVSTSA